MNAARRKQLNAAREMIQEAASIIEAVREEEEGAWENLPENLQDGDQGSRMQENFSTLEGAIEDLGGAEDQLNAVVED